MENLSEQQSYARAQRRVKAVSGFYRHLAVYLIVNLFLLALTYFRLDEGESFWDCSNFATAFFWGFGLLFHAFGVFWTNVFFGSHWEQRKIRELMEKEKQQKWE